MNVYEIEAPDHDAACRIARAIYSDIRDSHDWGKRFPALPSQAVLDCLAELSPRDMRKAINQAFGNASLAGHDEVKVEDIERREAKKSRIGF